MKINKLIITSLYLLITTISVNAMGVNKPLQGIIKDKYTGEFLIGVSVYFPELKRGVTTDATGKFVINNMPPIQTTIQISYVGHKTIIQTIDLNIVSDINFEMEESGAQIEEVVVTALSGNSLIKKMPSSVTYIPHAELQRSTSSNIIDAIAKQPGISQVTTGNGISKPVIRGLGYNRVVVVNDGIRQEGQQWGDEHGIEIDALGVNSVEILKGPASLSYGSDALAGVIDMKSAPSVNEGQLTSFVYTDYQTNSGLINYSLNNAGNKNGYVWDIRYGDKLAHAYKNKYDGYVYNSRFKERTASGLMGVNKSWGYSHLTLSYYFMQPGIIEGERDESTGKFVKQVFDPIHGHTHEAIATRKDFKSYGRQLPYQQINHYKAVLDNRFIIGSGNLKTILGYQQNQRKEYEEAEDLNQYSLYFKLHTFNYDVRYNFHEFDNYKISTGINGMYQSSLNKGHEILLPEYNLFDFGLFSIISKNFGDLSLSGGIRYDHRFQNIKSFTPHSHDHSHGHDDVTDKHGDDEHHDEETIAGSKPDFNGLSFSLGMAYRLSDNWNVKVNASHGFRAPNISELSAYGAHGGAIRYELGNRDLKSEQSWQIDLGLSYSSDIVSADIALFGNKINDFIFSRKLLSSNGADSIINGRRVYKYSSGDASLIGGEFGVDFHPVEQLHFLNTFSYVYSRLMHQSDSTKYLPSTPAPRWTSSIRYDIIKHGRMFSNMYVSFGMEYNFRQSKIYSAYGTETPTPGYALFNAGFGTEIKAKGRTVASIFFTADNIFDKAYQNHLSRLKYTDKNELTGRTGVYNMGRNLGMKIIIPFSCSL